MPLDDPSSSVRFALGMSPSSSTTDPAWETPPESSPYPRSIHAPKNGKVAQGKRPHSHGSRRSQRHASRRPHKPDDATQSSRKDNEDGLLRDKPPGIGSSYRHPTPPRFKIRRDASRAPAWAPPATVGTTESVPRDEYSYAMPHHYDNRPQMVPYAAYGDYFGPHNYEIPPLMPTPMPQTIPPYVPPCSSAHPYAGTATSSRQRVSPEAEELENIKKSLEEVKRKCQEQERQRRRDNREQEIRNEEDEAASIRESEIKKCEEEVNGIFEEAKQQSYNAVREEHEAEDRRRRLASEQYEEYLRIANEKIVEEMRREDEDKRRADEENLRILREAEAKVKREVDERRRVQREEEERLAQMRQEIEDRVRAEILAESFSPILSPRASDSMELLSSQHGGRTRSRARARRSSRPSRPSLPEQMHFSSTGGRHQRTLSEGISHSSSAHGLEEEGPDVVLNSDTEPDVPSDLLIYYQGRSTATPSSANEQLTNEQLSSQNNFEALDGGSTPIESRESVASPFSVFQYLVEETSDSDSDSDPELSREDYNGDDVVEEGDSDDGSADGGAALIGRNGQAGNSRQASTKQEVEEGLDATNHHPPAETTQAQDKRTQDYHLLRVLDKHIADHEHISQRNASVNVGSPSQDGRRDRAGSQTTTYPWTLSYVPSWFSESKPCCISSNSMLGRRRQWPREFDGSQLDQLAYEPAIAPDPRLLASDCIPILPMALVPCIMLPRNITQTVTRFPATDVNEVDFRPGECCAHCTTCGKNGNNRLIHTTGSCSGGRTT